MGFVPKSQTAQLVLCSCGIFICYAVYGVLQESISKGKYVDANGLPEKFTYALALVFAQCIINAISAKISLRAIGSTEVDPTSKLLYTLCSITYIGAMFSSNNALQYVAYPTQVLGKSVKPIPVMILGVLLARKRYPLVKYFFVLMIVIGVALFLYKDQKKSSANDEATQHTIGWGELLLGLSLMLDGLTGAIQDRMRHDGARINPYCLMYQLNAWSTVWLSFALILTGEGIAFIGFALRNPALLWMVLLFGVTSALGQIFIFLTISKFGPLTCSIVTTTRKLFTILFSVLVYGHVLGARQWVGTALVFTGLLLDNRYGKDAVPPPKSRADLKDAAAAS